MTSANEAIVLKPAQAVMEADPWRDKIDLIKRTVAKGVSDDELQLFLYTAKRTGLDPLAKQLHAVTRWNTKEGRNVMTIQTGIDGYRLIADRTGKLAGIDDPEYDDERALHPGIAKVNVYKLVGREARKFSASARWTEYCQYSKDGKPTSMWQKMPFLMLGKCAEALALRKAFPADLSGVYTFEEMAQADNNESAHTPEPQVTNAVATTAVQPTQQAATAPVVRQQPAAAPASSEGQRTPNRSTKPISEPQQKRLFAIAKGQNASVEDVKKVVKLCGYEHSSDIKMCDYEAICELFSSGRWADKLEEAATGIPQQESSTITADEVF